MATANRTVGGLEIMAPAVDRMVGGYHAALLLGGAPHLASLAPQVIP